MAGKRGIIHLPKAMKLQFPKFGGENTLGWIFKANQHFKYY